MKSNVVIPKSALEDLYILHEAVTDAENLTPFYKSTTAARCTILGLDQLHSVVQSRLTANSEELMRDYLDKLQWYDFTSLFFC